MCTLSVDRSNGRAKTKIAIELIKGQGRAVARGQRAPPKANKPTPWPRAKPPTQTPPPVCWRSWVPLSHTHSCPTPPPPPYEDFTSPYDVDCPVRGWLVTALLLPSWRAPPGAPHPPSRIRTRGSLSVETLLCNPRSTSMPPVPGSPSWPRTPRVLLSDLHGQCDARHVWQVRARGGPASART